MAKVIPVRVAVRIRPISDKETEEGCQTVVGTVDGRPQVYLSSLDKAFTFDFAFGADIGQKSVYDEAISDMLPNLFEGFNATVLAYGQTGSGKTHSMGTAYRSETTSDDLAGIIPRCVKDIFSEISARSADMDIEVRVSFVELYREQLYDLLSTNASKKEDCACDLREDPVKGVVIPGLVEIRVHSVDGTMRLLESGSLKRVTAATAMNNTSSRSHAIFTLTLNMAKKDAPSEATVAKFHLVDLAGSERASKTKAEGKRMKEGVAINQGLLALGNVISALGEAGQGHVPYRNSKLTRMLQDSLGGNSYTLMLSCVSPADSNVEETLGTLRYSDRARKIKNKPIVNVNGSELEVNRLRSENQELRMQVLAASRGMGIGGSNATEEEVNNIKTEAKKVREENRELIKALVACQDELTHMNEKVLLQESSGEKLKTKLKEALAEINARLSKEELPEFRTLQKTVSELVGIQQDAEQTLMDHEISRADISVADRTADDDIDDDQERTEQEKYGAEHALKQNALATQLNSLNKMLAQKERLAIDMNANDEKFQEMQQKYEESARNMEKEITALLKEKDELFQQQRHSTNDAASTKIAEMRRKKIQDLESQIGDLRKKMLEQNKAIKMNEKNAAQVKKLAEDIRNMKTQKVKLIRQIKEDAERVRVWKQQKEKEVRKLKEAERKQQIKIVKMETLHSKQQNVLRRKMEDAISVNKRLKDVVMRQKANRKQQPLNGSGLVGAGDRMRNWINEQMEVVVSVKEAAQTREQMMADRKTITKQLNEVKKTMRDTLTRAEIEENSKKMKDLQEDLDQRNVQINNLQKQITDLEQDGKEHNTSAGGTSSTNKNRFETVRTMTEAKIALDHLFERNVEQTVLNSQVQSEFNELNDLYHESVKNTNTLEKEIFSMKNEHETEMMTSNRDHEEKVLYLLKNMSEGTSDGERLKIHKAEINQFSKLHEELSKLAEENEKLRKQQLAADLEERKKMTPPPAKKQKTNKTKKTTVSYAEFLDEVSDTSEDEEDDDDVNDDPEWVKTPLFKRIKKLRRTGVGNATFLAPDAAGNPRALKRKNSADEDDEDMFAEPKPTKRAGSSGARCGCKNGCHTKRCSCKKGGAGCGEACNCDVSLCKNRGSGANTTALSDISNDTANTMSLLNDTYTTSVLGGNSGPSPPKRSFLNVTPTAPAKLPAQSFFLSPMEDENSPRPIASLNLHSSNEKA